MSKFVLEVVLALALIAVPAVRDAAFAQGKTVSRELELEVELQIARDERDQVLNRYEALQLQAQQLSAIVDQFIGQVQAPRIQKGNEARSAVEQKLITALGGDSEKGDLFDWRERALKKRDGTTVPLPKPEEKKQ